MHNRFGTSYYVLIETMFTIAIIIILYLQMEQKQHHFSVNSYTAYYFFRSWYWPLFRIACKLNHLHLVNSCGCCFSLVVKNHTKLIPFSWFSYKVILIAISYICSNIQKYMYMQSCTCVRVWLHAHVYVYLCTCVYTNIHCIYFFRVRFMQQWNIMINLCSS